MSPRRNPAVWLGTAATLVLGSQTQRIADHVARQTPTTLAAEALILGQALLYGVAPPHSDEMALQGTRFAQDHARWIALQSITENLSLYAFASSIGAALLSDSSLALAVGTVGVLSTMVHHAGKAWSYRRVIGEETSVRTIPPAATASSAVVSVRNDVPGQLQFADLPNVPRKRWINGRDFVEKKTRKAMAPTPQQRAIVDQVVATLPELMALLGVVPERRLVAEQIHFVDKRTFDHKSAGGYVQYGEIFIPADTPDKDLVAILTHEIVHFISPQMFGSYRKWHGGRTGLFTQGFDRRSTSQGDAFEGFNEAFVEALSFLYRILVFTADWPKRESDELRAQTTTLFRSGSLMPSGYLAQLYVFFGLCEKMAAHFGITPVDMFGRIARSQFAADGQAMLWIEEVFGVRDYAVLARMTGKEDSAFKTASRLGFDDKRNSRVMDQGKNGKLVAKYYAMGLGLLDLLNRQKAGTPP